MTEAKDLTKQPPRSPRQRLGGYAVLGRTLDKGRALLAGQVGDYHFDCRVDKLLFSFKGVTGDEVKKLLEDGATDEGGLSRNRRKFRHPSSNSATSASRSIILPSLWKV
jgi:hypothetical protein